MLRKRVRWHLSFQIAILPTLETEMWSSVRNNLPPLKNDTTNTLISSVEL